MCKQCACVNKFWGDRTNVLAKSKSPVSDGAGGTSLMRWPGCSETLFFPVALLNFVNVLVSFPRAVLFHCKKKSIHRMNVLQKDVV